LKRLWTALASDVAVFTFANNCVTGGEARYPRLPCLAEWQLPGL